jgi:DNA-binding NtrC family response regulator
MRPLKALPDLQALEEVRREYTLYVLERCRGNGVAAARTLGIDRKTLYRMLKRWRDDGP